MNTKIQKLIKIYKLQKWNDDKIASLKGMSAFLNSKIFSVPGQRFDKELSKTSYIDADHLALLKSEDFDKLDEINKELILRNDLKRILEQLPTLADLQYQKYLFDILVLDISINKEASAHKISRNILSLDLQNQLKLIFKNYPNLWVQLVLIIKKTKDPKMIKCIK